MRCGWVLRLVGPAGAASRATHTVCCMRPKPLAFFVLLALPPCALDRYMPAATNSRAKLFVLPIPTAELRRYQVPEALPDRHGGRQRAGLLQRQAHQARARRVHHAGVHGCLCAAMCGCLCHRPRATMREAGSGGDCMALRSKKAYWPGALRLGPSFDRCPRAVHS